MQYTTIKVERVRQVIKPITNIYLLHSYTESGFPFGILRAPSSNPAFLPEATMALRTSHVLRQLPGLVSAASQPESFLS
jgi:hypothetical protein